MTDIHNLIKELRHDILVGGGYTDVSGKKLEYLFQHIQSLEKFKAQLVSRVSCVGDSVYIDPDLFELLQKGATIKNEIDRVVMVAHD